MPPRAAYCRNASEPSRLFYPLHQGGGRQAPHQNGALDDIMKPVPAGNTSKFAALPVEDGPCAGRGHLDIPRRKIPMMNGRMDAAPAQCPGDNRKQAVPGAGLCQPRPIRGLGHRDRSLRINPGLQQRRKGSLLLAVGANRPQRNPAPARATAGTWKVARSLGTALVPAGTAARKDSSLSIKPLARSLRPALTTATGRCRASKTNSSNRWPSLIGLPARMPKVGSPCAGSPVSDARNLTKGSAGDTRQGDLPGPERQRCSEEPAQEGSGCARAAGLRRIKVHRGSRRTGLDRAAAGMAARVFSAAAFRPGRPAPAPQAQ